MSRLVCAVAAGTITVDEALQRPYVIPKPKLQPPPVPMFAVALCMLVFAPQLDLRDNLHVDLYDDLHDACMMTFMMTFMLTFTLSFMLTFMSTFMMTFMSTFMMTFMMTA